MTEQYVEWTNQLWAARGSIEQALGLTSLRADEEHVRLEVGSTPVTRLSEDGSWGGEALDAAMSIAAMNLSAYDGQVIDRVSMGFGLTSRTSRVLRRSNAERVFVTARMQYRGRSRLVIETVAEDDAGRELLRAENEFQALPQPIDFGLPSED